MGKPKEWPMEYDAKDLNQFLDALTCFVELGGAKSQEEFTLAFKLQALLDRRVGRSLAE
jgi:hypothetical protein